MRTLKIFESATQNIYGPNTLFMETALVESCMNVSEKILYTDEVSTQSEITVVESLPPDLPHEGSVEKSDQEIENIEVGVIVKEPTESVDNYDRVSTNDSPEGSQYNPESFQDLSRENEDQIDSTIEVSDPCLLYTSDAADE